MKMQALVIEKPNLVSVQTIDIPIPSDNEVLIKVIAAGICGTDINIYHGEYLGTYPVIPGHEFSGIVEAVGSAVSRFAVGDHVAVEPNICCNNCSYCLNNKQNFCENWQGVGVTLPGGMAQYVTAPEEAVFSIGGLNFLAGAFVEPLSCVLHGLQQLDIAFGDSILIAGAGPIGILLLQAVLLQGAGSVTQVDRDTSRLQMAKEHGATIVHSSLSALPLDAFDIVIDATGAIEVMNSTLQYAKKGAQILLFGVPNKDDMLNIPAFTIFEKGIKIMSSYTSVRNSLQAIALLKEKKIVVDSLVSHTLPLEKFTMAIEMIKSSHPNVRKIILEPWSK